MPNQTDFRHRLLNMRHRRHRHQRRHQRRHHHPHNYYHHLNGCFSIVFMRLAYGGWVGSAEGSQLNFLSFYMRLVSFILCYGSWVGGMFFVFMLSRGSHQHLTLNPKP